MQSLVVTRIVLVVCANLILVNCEAHPKKENVEKSQTDHTIKYEQDNIINSDSYVELEELSISKSIQLNFKGKILDPFNHGKLEVSIKGGAVKNDIDVFVVNSQIATNIESFTYSLQEDGEIICVFTTKQDVESQFKGQWSFSASKVP